MVLDDVPRIVLPVLHRGFQVLRLPTSRVVPARLLVLAGRVDLVVANLGAGNITGVLLLHASRVPQLTLLDRGSVHGEGLAMGVADMVYHTELDFKSKS